MSFRRGHSSHHCFLQTHSLKVADQCVAPRTVFASTGARLASQARDLLPFFPFCDHRRYHYPVPAGRDLLLMHGDAFALHYPVPAGRDLLLMHGDAFTLHRAGIAFAQCPGSLA